MRNIDRIVPREISSEAKLSRHISVTDLMVIVCTVAFAYNFTKYVHPALELPYMIFCVAAAVILIIPSKRSHNPGKKLYHSILYIFKKSRCVYHSIPLKGDEIENESEKEEETE